MILLIDGYNLIFGGFIIANNNKQSYTSNDFLESARDKLILTLRSYNIKRKHQIIVVFDGDKSNEYYPKQKESGGIRIIFSSAKSTADDVIIDIVSSYNQTKRQSVRVITSDQQLTDVLVKYRTKVTPASEFIRELSDIKHNDSLDLKGEPVEKFIGLQPSEVNKWLKLFKTTDEH